MAGAQTQRHTFGAIKAKERHVEIQGIVTKHMCNFAEYSCDGKYSFIGKGTGKGKKVTYAEAWQGTFVVLVD